ncbi:MAG: hypothetical protein KF861_13690 [Planctomycetaceae bacterium]|nr:hypothetical protein [Planctomycetaceae bacterium]
MIHGPSTTGSKPLSAVRFTKEVIRRYGLRGAAHVLVVGESPAELVSRLRSAGLMAFGLFDGHSTPRDPETRAAQTDQAPEIQPAVLHQSVPFLAHSFDCVILGHSSVYGGPLKGPEACTATANLLASLKPGRPLIYHGPLPADAMTRHLSVFPGEARGVILGTGGIGGLFRRLLGQNNGLPALQFTLPGDAISRLEWHRLARQAVMASQRQPAA